MTHENALSYDEAPRRQQAYLFPLRRPLSDSILYHAGRTLALLVRQRSDVMAAYAWPYHNELLPVQPESDSRRAQVGAHSLYEFTVRSFNDFVAPDRVRIPGQRTRSVRQGVRCEGAVSVIDEYMIASRW